MTVDSWRTQTGMWCYSTTVLTILSLSSRHTLILITDYMSVSVPVIRLLLSSFDFTPALAAVALPWRVAIVTASILTEQVRLINLDWRLLNLPARWHQSRHTLIRTTKQKKNYLLETRQGWLQVNKPECYYCLAPLLQPHKTWPIQCSTILLHWVGINFEKRKCV